MPRKHSTLAIAAAVGGMFVTVGGAGGVVEGAVVGWGSAVGGSFFDATRWERGTVPGTRDDVVFDARGSYTVSLSKSHTNARMLVGNDAVNLNLNGHEYRLGADISGSVLLGLKSGDASGLNLSNGTMRSSKGRLAYAPNSYASVNVLQGATWRNTGPLVVGQKGTADLNVSGGTLSSEGGRIGATNKGRGTVTLSGPESSWRVGGGLHVGGHKGRGKLTVSDGALVRVEKLAEIGIGGKIVVEGGTLSVNALRNDGELVFNEGTVHLRGQGLRIGDGRLFGEELELSERQTLKVGDDALIDRGSMLSLAGGRFVSSALVHNDGTILMSSGSRLAAKSVTINNLLAGSGEIMGDLLFADTGNLLLELGGRNPGVSYDRMIVEGAVTLTNVEVRLKDGFVPELGDHFEIVTADSITYSPEFSIELPELPEGLTFDVKQLDDCLHLYVVVPEPGVVGVVAAGAGLLMGRRRRR